MRCSISIITVCYNNLNGLKKTYDSIRMQTYTNYHWIVIDGDSCDGTKDFLNSTKASFSKCTFISEPDNGIYDAMNKGLNYACGDFCIFLNSGDELHDSDVLRKFTNHVTSLNSIYFGRALTLGKDISWLYPHSNVSLSIINKWSEKYLPNHQSMFFPRLFYKNNRYLKKLRYCGDTEYKKRGKKKCGFYFLDFPVCSFQLGGVSNYSGINICLRRIKETICIKRLYGSINSVIKLKIVMFSLLKFACSLMPAEFYHKVSQQAQWFYAMRLGSNRKGLRHLSNLTQGN